MKKLPALILASVFGFTTVTGYAATVTTAAPTPTAAKATPAKAASAQAPKVGKHHKVYKSAASKKVVKNEAKKTS